MATYEATPILALAPTRTPSRRRDEPLNAPRMEHGTTNTALPSPSLTTRIWPAGRRASLVSNGTPLCGARPERQ